MTLSEILASPDRAAIEARFWAKVDKSGGPSACWPWLGSLGTKGYGRFLVGDEQIGANRAALAFATNEDLGKLMALHECDNPPCCNPAHLFPGTNTANMRDMAAKKRGGQQRTKHGSAAPSRKLSVMDVLEIGTARIHGETTVHLADRFGISTGQVSNIALGRSWGWLWDRAMRE